MLLLSPGQLRRLRCTGRKSTRSDWRVREVARQDEYRRSGVDYEVLDEVKRQAIALASSTAPLLGLSGGVGFPSYRRDIADKEEWRCRSHAGSSTGISGKARSGWSGRPASRSPRSRGTWGFMTGRWGTG